MSPTEQLTIYTTANKRYEPFVLPYMTFALEHNPGAFVEVGLESPETFLNTNLEAFDALRDRHGPSMDVSAADYLDIAPHAARFLNQCENPRDYLYIGDIDIMLLEEIAPIHLTLMAKSGLPYSNIVRRNSKRLSGLHFTRTEAFYPVEKFEGDILHFDEQLLYQMILRKGLPLPVPDMTPLTKPSMYRRAHPPRPQHGFHLSLNRRVASANSVSWCFNLLYMYNYVIFTEKKFFQEFFPYFDRKFQRLFGVMDMVLESKYPEIYEELDRSWLLSDVFFD